MTVAVAGAALAAASVSFTMSLVLMRSAGAIGLVDPPGARKPQPRPVPLVGGALLAGAVAGAVAAARLAGFELERADLPWLAVPLLCFAIGVVDDARLAGLTPGVKALATLLALLPAMRAAGGGWAGAFEPRIAFAGLLAFAALHSCNTIDHAHGLCGLVALAGAASVAVAGIAAGELPAALLAALVGGSVLGFLLLNFPRGRVFLGDGGSLLLGGCFAAALIGSGRVEWLLLAAVPLADLASVALLRVAAGRAPWRGDRRHATHRLQALGLSEAAAVALLATVQAGCSAFAAPRLFGAAAPGGAALAAAVIGTLGVAMLLIPARSQER